MVIVRECDADFVYVSHQCRNCAALVMVKMIKSGDRVFYTHLQHMDLKACPHCGHSFSSGNILVRIE